MRLRFILRGLFAQLLAVFTAQPAIEAEHHKGDAQHLSLIQSDGLNHRQLPRLLHFLEELYEETEGEDTRQDPAKEIARAYFRFVAFVEPQTDGEEEQIEQGFVELSWMSRKIFMVLHEDKAQRRISGFAHNLGVHQVAQTDEAGRDGRGYGDIVEHAHQIDFVLSHVEPKGYHETQRTAVTRQTCVARKLPTAIGKVLHGEKHFERVSHEISPLIEEAVAQTRAQQDTHETIDEEGVKLFIGQVLVLIELHNNQIGQSEAYNPHDGVPHYGVTKHREGHFVWIPDDGQQSCAVDSFPKGKRNHKSLQLHEDMG